MRKTEVCRSWVVYRMTLRKGEVGGNVVCTQREWDAIEAANPGLHTLLYTGLKTEQEAEKAARGAPAAPEVKKPARAGIPFLLSTPT